jgi:hypothetical protein
MMVLTGVWFALAGALAVLAGLSARWRARRLRRHGLSVWATAVPVPAAVDGEPAGATPRTMLGYTLPDGRVLEQLAPARVRKPGALRPGQQVLVWYHPEDPQDILVYGRDGRLGDRALVITGVLVMLIGIALAAAGG